MAYRLRQFSFVSSSSHTYICSRVPSKWSYVFAEMMTIMMRAFYTHYGMAIAVEQGMGW